MKFMAQQSTLLLRTRASEVEAEQWSVGDHLIIDQDTESKNVESLNAIGQILWLAFEEFPKNELNIVSARKLTANEKHIFLEQKVRGDNALVPVRHCVVDSGLAMKVSSVIFSENGNNAIIHYTAPHRVDFRALVKVLARELRARITMKQISPQDEARLLGGIGPYGPCGWWPVDKFKS